MSTNLKPEKVKLHASFASIFYLTDDAAGYYVVGAFALTAIGTTHSSGVRGYAWCQEEPVHHVMNSWHTGHTVQGRDAKQRT